MARVIHFEIPMDHPDRTIPFYEKTFGWKVHKWDGPTEYWLVDTGSGEPGINGGFLKRPHPGATTCNTLGVTSLDDSLKAVEKAGGKIAVPRMPIPGMGWLAYCTDPDGNMFGMMQPDASAK